MDKHSPIHITLEQRDEAVTITQWVYNSLRKALMLGQLPPGRAVTIREMAALLDVSPMPIREALRQLAAEGALEILGNRRVMVPRMTAMKFAELVDARVALESHASLQALPYISGDILAQLCTLDQQIDVAEAESDAESVMKLNQSFHRRLYTANPHQVTMPLIESLWLQLAPFMRVAAANLEEYYQVDRHREAIQAIDNKDPVALQLSIAADIRDGCAFAASPETLKALINA